ncbi:MAG: WYL domain-containing protein [Ruminococcaceae bacterium]|nr:WYL domain-containing protein [Oscillospiraceae bacterium]
MCKFLYIVRVIILTEEKIYNIIICEVEQMADLIKITRNELYNMVWDMPISEITKQKDIAYPSVIRACEEYNIPRPETSYWARNEEKREAKIPLPEGENATIYLNRKLWRNKGHLSSHTPKEHTVCILRILECETDINRGLSTKEIIALMYKRYQLSIERRTVYAAIKILYSLDYNIVSENYKYKLLPSNKSFIRDRAFDPDEVQFLLESITLNPLLPKEMERALYYKTARLMPKHNRSTFHNAVLGTDKRKMPACYYGNIDEINIAIAENKKIKFYYMKYNFSAKQEKMYDEEFVLSPVYYTTENLIAYIICASDDMIRYKFRIDRMADLEAIDMPRIDVTDIIDNRGRYKCYDMDYNSLTGTVRNAKLICDNNIATQAIEYFKFEASIKENDDSKTFTLTASGTLEQLLSFALRFQNQCEVSEPQDIRNKVIDIIKNNKYNV